MNDLDIKNKKSSHRLVEVVRSLAGTSQDMLPLASYRLDIHRILALRTVKLVPFLTPFLPHHTIQHQEDRSFRIVHSRQEESRNCSRIGVGTSSYP